MGMIGWRVWYTNGAVFSSAETRWEELPRDGVLGVKVYEDTILPNGRHGALELTVSDYYFRALSDRGVHFIGGTSDSLADIYRRYQNPCILRGKWTDNDHFEAIRQEMMDWHDPPVDGPGA